MPNLSQDLKGYRGAVLELLQKAGVKIGDLIKVERNGQTYEGYLMPRYELSSEQTIVIKLKNGYNIGVRATPNTKVTKIGEGHPPVFAKPPTPPKKPGLPEVAIVSTGGTIASRVDYRTGAVLPALSAEDLYSTVPELSDVAAIDAEILFSIFSENMTPKQWTEIAKTVAKHIERGVDGVVVCHGTDTMGYTAAALSFALQNLPVPVVLVGSQRSSDRPSSDAALNLISAVRAAAYAPFAEVVVAMHETSSDTSIALHRGTKVRKCHTSRRDTFKSINARILGRVVDDKIEIVDSSFRPRDKSRKLVVKPDFSDKAALIKFYPGMSSSIIDHLVDDGFRGIVLEGTGLGHVGNYLFDSVRRAVREGVVVAMTSQCLWGRVNMNVYDTGVDLLRMGVVPLEDMLPETAYVKMSWALAQTDEPAEVVELLRTNIANEFSPRTEYVESWPWES